MKMNRPTKLLIALILVTVNVSCDQITKKEVRENIELNERINVVGHNFILTKVENTGAALSFGNDFHPTIKLLIFQIMPILVLLYMFYYLMKSEEISKTNFIAISFIIGGGIGNIIDRVLYNSVTDFMFVEIGAFHTGIFNMADLSITIGGIVLIVHNLLGKNKIQQKTPV